MQQLVTRGSLELLTLAGTLGCWKWLAWQHWGSSCFPGSSCQCILGHTWAWVLHQLPESLPILRLLALCHYLWAHSLSESNKIFISVSLASAIIMLLPPSPPTLWAMLQEMKSQINGQGEANPAGRGRWGSGSQQFVPPMHPWFFSTATGSLSAPSRDLSPSWELHFSQPCDLQPQHQTLHFFRSPIPFVMARNICCCRSCS